MSDNQAPYQGAVQHCSLPDLSYSIPELKLPPRQRVLVELIALPQRSQFQSRSVALVRRWDQPPEVEMLVIESEQVRALLTAPECARRLHAGGRVVFDAYRSSLAAPEGGDYWSPADLEGRS